MSKHQVIAEALSHIFKGIEILKDGFPPRKFTIDGRLVGDIGEIIGELEYDIVLDEVQRAEYDGVTSDGRKVQIKATFKDQLTFKRTPECYLGFKLDKNGGYEEVFNGPGQIIFDHFSKLKDIGTKLLPLPVLRLRELSKLVEPNQRIPKRTEQPSPQGSVPLP